MLKKIVVIGPESTGKSTLSQQLADHYHTVWCPEYAREYLLKHGMNYSYDDLLTISKGQVALEDKFSQEVGKSESPKVRKRHSSIGKSAAGISDSKTSGLPDFRTSGLLFIDTDMYVMKVWCEFVFRNCHRFILDEIVKRQYDLYLLCNIDLPWTKDELREYPDLESRQKLYSMYKDIMINQAVPWVDINGNYEERLQKAITATEKIVGDFSLKS